MLRHLPTMEAKIKAILASKATNDAKAREIMRVFEFHNNQQTGAVLLELNRRQWVNAKNTATGSTALQRMTLCGQELPCL